MKEAGKIENSATKSPELLAPEQEAEAIKLIFDLHRYNEASEADFAKCTELLNYMGEDFRRQPVALDKLYFLHDDELIGWPLKDEETLVGRFEQFVLKKDADGRHDIYIQMIADIAGLPKEETTPLWHEEAQALRWPNFNSQPNSKPNFWKRLLRSV